MAREREEKRIHLGDVVYIDAKDVEGIVTYTDALTRQCRIDDSDPETGAENSQTNTMFYSWEECEVVTKADPKAEPTKGRRTVVEKSETGATKGEVPGKKAEPTKGGAK